MPGSPNYTIEYSFLPGQEVWVIYNCGGTPKVEGATVIRVRGEVLTTNAPSGAVEYDVQLNSASAGTTVVLDANMFDTLSRAVADYETRLAAL